MVWWRSAPIPQRRHGHRHRHPRRHPREDRRENVGVSFSLPQEYLQEIARVGHVGDDTREDVRVGVGVGVVEFQLDDTQLQVGVRRRRRRS